MRQVLLLLPILALAGCIQDTSNDPGPVQPGTDPVASFSFTSIAVNPVTIQFENSSTDADSFLWDFGDSSTSVLKNPTKVYTKADTFRVTLTAKNTASGKSSTIMHQVAVGAVPAAAFTFTGLTVAPATIVFVNTSMNANSYRWDFGDGTTSTQPNPTKVYAQQGTFTVKLRAANTATGASDTVAHTITIQPPALLPSAAFSFTGSTVAPATITFQNASTGADTYLWQFGDNTTSTETSPNKVFNTAGQYTVRLTATNSTTGKFDTASHPIVIQPPRPVAAFTFSGITVAPATIQFQNGSINSNSYTWDFGDGTSSTQTSPIKTFSRAGSYVIKLTATNSATGKFDTVSHPIIIEAPRTVAAFSYSGVAVVPATIQFQNSSINANTYLWDFGDGNTSTETSPLKIYATSGTFLVRLRATNASTGQFDTVSHSVAIGAAAAAAFTFSGTTVAPATIQFQNSSTNANSYLWEFGDNTTSTEISPIKLYSSEGTYSVRLTATNTANGTSGSVTHQVVIDPPGPVAAFTYTGVTAVPATIQFQNSSTNANSYVWDFGDGTSSTQANPVKVYTTAGTFTIKLTASNTSTGKSNTATQQIAIGGATAAAFTFTGSTVAPATITFENSSANANAFRWTFGDGTGSTQTNPTKVYQNAGTYNVKLVATNSSTGRSDSVTHQIVIDPAAPVAGFSYTGTTVAPATITFQNSSTNASGYFWDFGDGTTSTSTNPTKIYSDAGTFRILLTATNMATGKFDTVSHQITIRSGTPVASFTYSGVALAPATITFTNTSQNADAYLWDFGDGVTSTATNPSKTYSAAGMYTVVLKATNSSSGRTNSATQTITIDAGPVASFTYSGPNTSPAIIVFQNTSQFADSYLWDFGDGTTSTTQNPIKVYSAGGRFTVKLTATNSTYQRSAQSSQQLNIFPGKVFVDRIIVDKIPFSDALGQRWDPTNGPDLYPALVHIDTVMISLRDTHVNNVRNDDLPVSFPIGSGFEITEWTREVRVQCWDYDDADPDDFMGATDGFVVSSIIATSGFVTSVPLQNASGSIKLRVILRWQ